MTHLIAFRRGSYFKAVMTDAVFFPPLSCIIFATISNYKYTIILQANYLSIQDTDPFTNSMDEKKAGSWVEVGEIGNSDLVVKHLQYLQAHLEFIAIDSNTNFHHKNYLTPEFFATNFFANENFKTDKTSFNRRQKHSSIIMERLHKEFTEFKSEFQAEILSIKAKYSNALAQEISQLLERYSSSYHLVRILVAELKPSQFGTSMMGVNYFDLYELLERYHLLLIIQIGKVYHMDRYRNDFSYQMLMEKLKPMTVFGINIYHTRS